MKFLKIKILFTLLISFQVTLAQEKDSISMLLNSYTSLDTLRSKQLINASNYFTYNNPERALEYINEGLNIAKKKHWKNGVALAINQKGTIYYTMADNLKALDFYLEALRVSEQINNQTLTINVYNNLANIYADMKNFDKALANYNNCLKIANQQNDTINSIRAFNNIGNVYSETNSVDTSLIYFDKALFLAKEQENAFFVAAIINNKGLAYKRKNDYKNSLKYYTEALKISQKINNKYIEASALNSLAKVAILQREFIEAEKYATKALIVSKDINAVEWQADSWQVLNKVYENNKNYEQSLITYKQYIKLRDSVTNEEKQAELTKKDMQYQLNKQETYAEAAIKHQTFIKNSAIGVGGFLLLFLVIGSFLYKRKRDAEFKTKMAETELKALCSQMNPHFIFNSLNSISHYLQTNNVQKADDYLTKFSKLTRSILENSEKKWIPLREDLELLKLYIEIESLRLKNKLAYNIKIDASIDIDNTLIPPLILQPFIENSIWHGISKKENEGIILIEIKSSNKKLICAVEDNGVGRNGSFKNFNDTNNSMGIKITNQRLEIINEIKHGKGTINFIDKLQGLRVELSLPLELKF
jgi:tetratricopeptide (TPR) repeat protein